MGNKSVRISTTAGGNDKYVTLKLENDIDFFEILSLKISQKDVYGSFNSDYGVIVGRVIANGGVGVPNAKLSVFIPISDEDKSNSEIVAVYPYTSPRDKDLNGVRYNLLPRVAVNNPFIVEGDYAPKVPVGTFPTKEEITTNETFLEVYEKYYKFTTISNNSGDYMFFGVPIGIQTVHMSVDITDIGKYSMTPATMVKNLGYSPNLFTDNGTKIKYSTDLETIPSVELQEIAVEVRPFWGDSENFEIGITRQDFKVRALITTGMIVFGSAFTDQFRSTWGSNESNDDEYHDMWRINPDGNINVGIANKRIGTISTQIYYIPSKISDADADAGNFDTKTEVVELTTQEYVSFVDKGQFVYLISCNRKKVITNEFGDDVEVDPTNPNGVFIEFRGMFYNQYGVGELPTPTFDDISGRNYDDHTFFGQRWKMKIPQFHPDDITTGSKYKGNDFNSVSAKYENLAQSPLKSHGLEGNATRLERNEDWRKMHFTFEASKFYSVAKYHPLSYNKGSGYTFDNPSLNGSDPFNNAGIIITSAGGNFDDDNPTYELQHNNTINWQSFGGQWLNMCLYFPQHTFFYSDDKQSKSNHLPVSELDGTGNGNTMYLGNSIRLIGSVVSTSIYLRNDWNKTTFIEIPKEDVILMVEKSLDRTSKKGFRINPINSILSDVPYDTDPLIGKYKYRNLPSPFNSLNTDLAYIYKGLDTADCVLYLNSLGLV